MPVAKARAVPVPAAPGPAPTGYVDLVDVERGTRGWAVDTAEPGRPVRVELCVGAAVVATVQTSEQREDISEKFGQMLFAGFVFDMAAMEAIPKHARSPDDLMTVRFADGGATLGAGVPLPTSGAVAAKIASLPKAAPPLDNADIEMMLDVLRRQAAPLAQTALRPVPEGLRGYIETLVIDPSGTVWFIGWMRQGHPPEFGAVIADTGKHAAAAAIMSFAREDLPSDARGVLGILATEWRPGPATKAFHLFFGPGGRFHLSAHTPLRIIGFKELLGDYANMRERCVGDRHTEALQRMLAALEIWLPGRATGQRYGTECSLDRILLVPGLGCLAEGWIMSPMKRVEGLRMRVGASVMAARPESLFWKPRPDLATAFPRSEPMTRRAGFVAMFAGVGDTSDLADPVLKIMFEGGVSANWDIAAKVFRRLGHSATIEDALTFFPALQDEPFFARFARSAIAIQQDAPARLVTLRSSLPQTGLANGRAEAAIVAVLPDDRCDMFLLFEEMAQRIRLGGAVPRMVFLASAGAQRSDALWLFREFEETMRTPCSLMLVDEAEHALRLLPELLRETATARFVFLAPGMFLTESGWAEADRALAPGRDDLVLFGMKSDESVPSDEEASLGARSFAWSAAAFSAWSHGTPAFFGGFHRDNGLRHADPRHEVRPGAVRCTRRAAPTRLCLAVNEAVFGKEAAL